MVTYLQQCIALCQFQLGWLTSFAKFAPRGKDGGVAEQVCQVIVSDHKKKCQKTIYTISSVVGQETAFETTATHIVNYTVHWKNETRVWYNLNSDPNRYAKSSNDLFSLGHCLYLTSPSNSPNFRVSKLILSAVHSHYLFEIYLPFRVLCSYL